MTTIQFPGLSPIPPLGIGCWQWGDKLVWSYGSGYQESDLKAVYDTAIKGGVRLFDSAEFYGFGMSERLLGKFYQEHPEKPLLVSKMYPYPWRFSRKVMIGALKNSLNRLQLSQLDLYLLHWPWPPVSLESWAESLAEAYELGLTKAVGVSNHDAKQLERISKVLAKHKVPLASNQVEFNLLQRKAEHTGLLKAMQTEGIVAMAYSPLGMGWLSGKYSLDNPPPGRYRGMRYMQRKNQIPGLLQTLREIAETHQVAPSQVALRWCIQKGTLPIPGAKNARQAEGNAGALRIQLSNTEMLRLDSTG